MYRSATVHSLRHRQTGVPTDDSIMRMADHNRWQYDRLKWLVIG